MRRASASFHPARASVWASSSPAGGDAAGGAGAGASPPSASISPAEIAGGRREERHLSGEEPRQDSRRSGRALPGGLAHGVRREPPRERVEQEITPPVLVGGLGRGEQRGQVPRSEDGLERAQERRAEARIVVTAEPEEEPRHDLRRARGRERLRGRLLDVHVGVVQAGGDGRRGPARLHPAERQERLPRRLHIAGARKDRQAGRERLRAVAREEGDGRLAHVGVAVAEQAVDARQRAPPRRLVQGFEEDDALSGARLGPVEEIEHEAGEERVAGLLLASRVE